MNFTFGAPEIVLLSFVVLVVIPLVDIWKITPKDSFEKIAWTCIVLLFPFVGVIAYFSVGRKEKYLYHVIKKFKSAS